MYSPLLVLASQAARQGGLLARAQRDRLHRVESKTDRADLVSEVDRQVEQELRTMLLLNRPDDGFLGEEAGEKAIDDPDGGRWIVDPIDGTLNYLSGFAYYCTSVAWEKAGKVEVAAIYDPEQDVLYTARRGQGAWSNGLALRVSNQNHLADAMLATGFRFETDQDQHQRVMQRLTHMVAKVRGVRRPGAAALDLAHLACGHFDGFWECGLKPWDAAAAILLIREAGGLVSDGHGQPYKLGDPLIVASNPTLHPTLLQAIKDADAKPLFTSALATD